MTGKLALAPGNGDASGISYMMMAFAVHQGSAALPVAASNTPLPCSNAYLCGAQACHALLCPCGAELFTAGPNSTYKVFIPVSLNLSDGVQEQCFSLRALCLPLNASYAAHDGHHEGMLWVQCRTYAYLTSMTA